MDKAIEQLGLVSPKAPNGYEASIEINGYEYDAIYQYEYIRGCKGGTGDFGMKAEPDAEPEVNIYKVLIMDDTWHEVYIPDEALTDIQTEILAHYE